MKESLSFSKLGQWNLKKSEDWMVHSDHEDRDFMPKMKGEQRDNALKDLKEKTQSRVNEKTGDTEYLLHRGVGEQEAWLHHDNDIDDKTSWTPHYHVAHGFSQQYNRTGSTQDKKERTLSAWVPDKHIHAIPIHGADPKGEFNENLKAEHEVVVSPHKFNYANQDTRDAAHEASKKAKLI